MIWLLLACTDPVELTPAPQAPPSLEAPRLLRRASLDLRGKLPSATELNRVAADPELYEEIATSYLQDPAVEDRMVELLNEKWWTRLDVFEVNHMDYGLSDREEHAFNRSVGEEPLRLMAHVIAADLPWSTVVTSDWTMANPMLAELWELEREDGDGWQKARYPDSRPAVGVLATNGLWWRYTTTASNMNRSRAAAISRLLVCADYLGRPISFAEGETVVEVEAAVRNDPYCLACHATIDPLAANLFGFWWLSQYSRVEQQHYHPEREALAEQFLEVSPAYFGTPIEGLGELGWAMSQDPRYYSCAVQNTAELLWRRPVDLADREELEAMRAKFVDDGGHMHALLVDLITSQSYRNPPDPESVDAVPLRMISPSQLDSTLLQIASFQWEQEGFDQLHNDIEGYRVLAGGVDGYAVTSPQTKPGLPWSAVVKRSAQVAAAKIVEQAGRGEGLLSEAPLQEGSASEDFEPAVSALFWRLTATELEASELAELTSLWDAVAEESGAEAAWEVLVTVFLRDPRFLTY